LQGFLFQVEVSKIIVHEAGEPNAVIDFLAGGSSARRLLTAASANGRRTVVRPLQTVRSASDADDNRTALYAPPTARFTDLRMSVQRNVGSGH
jgi:hypothetical protein